MQRSRRLLPNRAARRAGWLRRAVRLAVLHLALGHSAWAQNAPLPKFEAGKPAAKDPSWAAQAKGSLLVTSGNSQSRSAILGASCSHHAGAFKLSLDGQLAYGRSSTLVPVFDPANPMLLVGIGRQESTTTNQWQARARDDYFFTENNAAYLLGQIGADKIAGKELAGGAQAGYSRQVYKDEHHLAVAEIGYDFSYEKYAAQPGREIDPVQIQSARLFVGEQLTVSSDTGVNASVEALFNLNKEKALNAADRARSEVDPFKDTRVVGKLGLTTRLYQRLSFAFGLTIKYDQNPAPQPLPPGAKEAMLAPGFEPPFADKVDTLTEATLIFTFL